jgi:hypothetical protein
MDINVALMASISAVSGGAGVIVAALALRRQRRQEVLDLVCTSILTHQSTCSIGDTLSEDIERNRKETISFLESVRSELRTGLDSVNKRLDTIYVLVGKGKK